MAKRQQCLWRQLELDEDKKGKQTNNNGYIWLGGPVEKMCFFQIAPTLCFSILIFSNRYHNDILKVSLKTITMTYPLGTSNIELFCANRIPRFTCYFLPYLHRPEHMHMGQFKYVKTFYYMIERCV